MTPAHDHHGEHTGDRPTIVGIPDQDVADAVARPGGVARLAVRIEASGAAAVVIGADRFDAEHGRGHRLDPTAAALALGRALPGHGLFVAVAPTREHPYNVARRVLSLDHVLDGRVGILVGARDHGVPSTPYVHDPVEFAAVVRGLWRTWPLDSIVGDRETGVFAETDRITSLDHDGGPGGYRVRGPLTTPSSRQGEPVLAVWHDVDLPSAELVLGGAEHPLPALPPDAGEVPGPAATAATAAGGAAPTRASRPTLRQLVGLDVPTEVTA